MERSEAQAYASIAAKNTSSYQIRPPFKDKFRPAQAKDAIEKIIPELVKQAQQNAGSGKKRTEEGEEEEAEDWKSELAKTLSAQSKQTLINLKKDERYKYIVQTTVGENNGQGMKVQSRCCWDEDTDDAAYVSFQNEAIFVVIVAFAVYMY